MFFIGIGQDEDELKRRIKENDLEDNIILCGKITDRKILASYLARSDLFLFPSLYDASSLVQIEAASQKTPTVFLRGSATSATVTENVNGYISENSVEAFAEKIVEIFSKPEEYAKICENAYNDLYVSWDKAVEKAYNDYLGVLKKRIIKINA